MSNGWLFHLSDGDNNNGGTLERPFSDDPRQYISVLFKYGTRITASVLKQNPNTEKTYRKTLPIRTKQTDEFSVKK